MPDGAVPRAGHAVVDGRDGEVRGVDESVGVQVRLRIVIWVPGWGTVGLGERGEVGNVAEDVARFGRLVCGGLEDIVG